MSNNTAVEETLGGSSTGMKRLGKQNEFTPLIAAAVISVGL